MDRTAATGGPGQGTVFTNRVPAFLWGFAVVWYAMVGAFTWLILQDGAPKEAPPAMAHTVLALCWFAGVAIVSMALSSPCTRVVVGAGTVEVDSRFPHRRVHERFRVAELLPAEVTDSVDSEGDPYHSVIVRIRAGSHFTLEEGHDRPACEAAARRFNRAAGLSPPGR